MLCVSKALTNNFSSIKSGSGEDTHWGHFMVSQKWWCGTNEVGGQCNIRCNDLLTDFAKNANCGLKVYKIHGLSAWKLQNVCLDVEIGDLDECLDAKNKVQERRGKKIILKTYFVILSVFVKPLTTNLYF